MKRNMRYAMTAAFLMVTSLALGNNVTIADGISNGTITASSTTANAAATITLTVTPSDGYYITANDITIIQTGDGGMAQTRTEPDIAATFHPVASTIDAEGKGTYTFTMPVSNVRIEATFIARTVVSEATVNLSATSFTYNGSVQKPSVTSVTKDEITYLVSESTNGYGDYDVTIPNSINATESPFTAEVTFRGMYTGTASATYTINQASISNVDIAAISDQTYTGSPLTPEPVVKDLDISTTPLVKDKDYTVSYADDHTNVSDAVTVTITGMGNYDNTTTASTTFKIIAATLDATTLNNKITLSSTSFEYTGEEQAPTVTIEGLKEGTDFTVKYKNGDDEATTEKPKDVNTYTIVIVGKGNYTGEVITNKNFQITKATATIATTPTAKKNLVYTGELQDLITAGTGSNGMVQYSLDNETYNTAIPQGKEAQEYTVYYKVVGNDNYNDSEVTTLNVIISAAVLNATTLNNKITLSSTSFEYTGEEQAPTVTIEGLKEGTDFTVKYKNGDDEATTEKPKDAGTYTIVIVGKSNYSGETITNETFIIKEPKAGINDNSKPVTVNGETFYNLTEETAEVIDNTIKVDIALPAEADTRTTITTTGALIFSIGTDLNMVIKNLKLYNIVVFIFTGDLYGDSSHLRLKDSATRGTRDVGDLKLTSGAEYEVISEGDMILTMKLGEEETTLTSISVKASSTGINAAEAGHNTYEWFDLNGKRINEPTHKGLYIRNGKKIVIK